MDLYQMERKIIDSRNDVISKDYALAFVFAYRSRVKELEDEIHQLKEEQLVGQNRVVRDHA